MTGDWRMAAKIYLLTSLVLLSARPSLGQGSTITTGESSTSSASSSDAAIPTTPGPYSVPTKGSLAGLSTANVGFKEVDYIGRQAERQRYPDANDFLFDFPAREGKLTIGKGGNSLQLDINNKPVLYGSNAMSQTIFTLTPCGLNVPHVHPRAGKVVYVLEGQVNIGFVEENGGRAIGQNVSAGQGFVIPRGLAMWIHNLECQQAQYLDTWQNNDPGIMNMMEAILKMPLATIATAIGISTQDAETLVSRKLSSIELGPQECLERCNQTTGIHTLSSPIPSPIALLQTG